MSENVTLVLTKDEARVLDKVVDAAMKSGTLINVLKTAQDDEALVTAMVKLHREVARP